MGKLETNNDTSTPLRGTEFFFFVKWRCLFFNVYMGTTLSGAWHIICAFNKGILFIGIFEDPAVPVWAGESVMTWRGTRPFHHVLTLTRYFSVFHFMPVSKHNHFIAKGLREMLWGWLDFKGMLMGPQLCCLWAWEMPQPHLASSLTLQQRHPECNIF